jgi:hypothetical protein
MSEDTIKREHSTKPEKDDLTDYQSVNSLGGAGVLVDPKEVPPPANYDEEETRLIKKADPDTVTDYSGDYKDGADFTVVDDEGRTNG